MDKRNSGEAYKSYQQKRDIAASLPKFVGVTVCLVRASGVQSTTSETQFFPAVTIATVH